MDIDESVYIVSYNEQWPLLFEEEKRRLQKSLNNHVKIEHSGSTAVPELSSKPIIDIMIGVKNYPPSEEFIRLISSLGYFFHGEAGVTGRLYFTYRNEHKFNLAVVMLDGNHWTTNIKFRNYLREHPEARHKYDSIKTAALNEGAKTLLPYSDYKKKFIADILEKL